MTRAGPPRLALSGLTKTFGGMRALDNVDLTVMPGEIHGLLGKNGSGKSTLIKVLSGYHAPDAGRMEMDGASVHLPMHIDRCEAHGLAFVHQNLSLVPEATVLENLIAGDHRRARGWRIHWRREAARARALFEKHDLALDPDTQVADLSPVDRAQFAILRAADRIGHGAGVLILDEPTPFLPLSGVKRLFALMRSLAKAGTSIVFVSHDIDEVMEVTDRATVLRDGRVITGFDTAGTARETIVEAIVGEAVDTRRAVGALPAGAPLARVEALADDVLFDVALDVGAGEVVGLTGLIGSGFDRVPHLLAGARKASSGTLRMGETVLDLAHLTPAAAIRAGLVLIPADRARAGLTAELSLVENAMLPRLGERLRVPHGACKSATQTLMERFGVKASAADQPAAELSGGNQQKLVLGKWLQLSPRLVLLDEPTQGIDVGARRDIYARLADLSAAGAGIVCATSEFEQLESIAHRVLVFDQGRIVAELKGADVTKAAIAAACYDARPAQSYA
ncbi:MAG: sugar ABC transporter ATP-binding protein [Pseudomonadota bacterium]